MGVTGRSGGKRGCSLVLYEKRINKNKNDYMLVLYSHQPPGQNTGMYNKDSSGQIQAEGHPNIYTGSTCYMLSCVLHRQRLSFIYYIILKDENILYLVFLLL